MNSPIAIMLIFLVIYLAVGFTFGWIGSLIGKGRGRHSVGFWLGFFLGPPGWVIALFLPRGEDTGTRHATKVVHVPTHKACSLCGKFAGLQELTCPDCGNTL